MRFKGRYVCDLDLEQYYWESGYRVVVDDGLSSGSSESIPLNVEFFSMSTTKTKL